MRKIVVYEGNSREWGSDSWKLITEMTAFHLEAVGNEGQIDDHPVIRVTIEVIKEPAGKELARRYTPCRATHFGDFCQLEEGHRLPHSRVSATGHYEQWG